MNPEIRRRSLAAGAAWAIPAVAVSTGAPAVAASTGPGKYTAVSTTPQSYYSEFSYAPATCNGTTHNAGGFIDTQGCTPAGGPATSLGKKDGDCLLSASSSIGTWLESSTTGTGAISNFTQTYAFTAPIQIVNCPSTTYSQQGTWRWTQCNTLNGWTYTLSADGKTLTMQYTGTVQLTSSTATNGTGTYFPGYFINFIYPSTCPTSATTITRTSSLTYYDATNPTGKLFTKNTAARPVM